MDIEEKFFNVFSRYFSDDLGDLPLVPVIALLAQLAKASM